MNFTYAQYIGIVDIVIIIGLIITIIIGTKKGFLLKALSISKKLCGIVVALAFCVRFANSVLYPWFGNNMQSFFYSNIMSNESFAQITTQEQAISTLKSLGIPNFISQIILNTQDINVGELAQNIATNLACFATTTILIIISFFILWIGTKIIFVIFKLLAKLLRTSKIVRVFDGILGIVLYAIMYYAILQIIFFVVIILFNKAGWSNFNTFVTYDIKGLTSGLGEGYKDASFRLSAWIYSNNFLGNLIGLLF